MTEVQLSNTNSCFSNVFAQDGIERNNVECNIDDDDPLLYGTLVVLGTNGRLPGPDATRRTNKHIQDRRTHKINLFRRPKPNGVKRSNSNQHAFRPQDINKALCVTSKERYSVSYGLHHNNAIVVEYEPDELTDMFQIGRSSDAQTDFCVMDMDLLRSGRGDEPLGIERSESVISRFACRILIERTAFPHRARIFAAGFDPNRNIFLGERAIRFKCESGEPDGFTTNGVLLHHPNSPLWPSEELCPQESIDDEYEALCVDKSTSLVDKDQLRITETNTTTTAATDNDGGGGSDDVDSSSGWLEVSVNGRLFSMVRQRAIPNRHRQVLQSNVLRDGTLIDLCGVTLMWRAASGLNKTTTEQQLDEMIEVYNGARLQCPINCHTLQFPRREFQLLSKSHQASSSSSKTKAVNGGGNGLLKIGFHNGKKSKKKCNNHNNSIGSNNNDNSANGKIFCNIPDYYAGIGQPTDQDRCPMVYIGCGHVHGSHIWKIKDESPQSRTCPLCMRQSAFIPILLGLEVAYYVDQMIATHVFVPCGHLASENTTRYWSNLKRPNKSDHLLQTKCPFCDVVITDAPLRLIFP